MATLGYARISTTHQSLDQQRDALHAAGVKKIFVDQLSDARDDRPGLTELLAYARSGDVVIVVALNRLGRSLTGVINIIDDLQGRDIVIRSLREGVDFGTSVGRMVAQSLLLWPSTSGPCFMSGPPPRGRRGLGGAGLSVVPPRSTRER